MQASKGSLLSLLLMDILLLKAVLYKMARNPWQCILAGVWSLTPEQLMMQYQAKVVQMLCGLCSCGGYLNPPFPEMKSRMNYSCSDVGGSPSEKLSGGIPGLAEVLEAV